MLISPLTPLPAPPLSTDSESVFNSKADATLLAEKAFVDEMNSSTIPGINLIAAEVADARSAAAESASSATTAANIASQQAQLATTNGQAQVSLATMARQSAETARDQSQAYAQAAGAAVGPAPVPLKFLGTDSAGVVSWREAGQAIGDMLITAKTTPPMGYLLPDTLYSKSTYPELSAMIGAINYDTPGSNGGELFIGTSTNSYTAVAGYEAGPAGVLVVVGSTANNSSSNAGSVAYRSTDGGHTWLSISTLTGLSALISVATNKQGVWLAGAYDGNIYRSTDDGVTWSYGSFIPSGAAHIINWDDPSHVYIMTKGTASLNRSDDSGISWKSLSPGLGNISSFSVHALSSSLFITFSSSIYRSLDFGVTFSRYFSSAGSVFGPVCNPFTSLMLLVQSSCIYLSKDSGLSWNFIGFSTAGGISGAFVADDKCVYVKRDSVVTKSEDGGESWFSYSDAVWYSYDAYSSLARPVSMYRYWFWVSNQPGRIIRSVPRSAYDAATVFRTPPKPKLPVGQYAYIKGKSA